MPTTTFRERLTIGQTNVQTDLEFDQHVQFHHFTGATKRFDASIPDVTMLVTLEAIPAVLPVCFEGQATFHHRNSRTPLAFAQFDVLGTKSATDCEAMDYLDEDSAGNADCGDILICRFGSLKNAFRSIGRVTNMYEYIVRPSSELDLADQLKLFKHLLDVLLAYPLGIGAHFILADRRTLPFEVLWDGLGARPIPGGRMAYPSLAGPRG